MTSTENQKLSKLNVLYADNLYASNATKEVEAMRRKATNYGYLITAAAFIGNEACRLTLRTRKFLLCYLSFVSSLVQVESSQHRFLAPRAHHDHP